MGCADQSGVEEDRDVGQNHIHDEEQRIGGSTGCLRLEGGGGQQGNDEGGGGDDRGDSRDDRKSEKLLVGFQDLPRRLREFN